MCAETDVRGGVDQRAPLEAPDVLTMPLLVGGAVPGTLTLRLDASSATLSRATLQKLTGRVELMLSSPVLIAQADANAQWLQRARQAGGNHR